MPRPKPDGDRRHRGQQAGGGQLAQRVLGADVDDAAVLGLLGVVHDPGVLAELAAHLEDDGAGRPGHGVDGEAGEHEHHCGTEDQADQHVGRHDLLVEHRLDEGARLLGQPDRGRRARLPGVGVGAEQRRRREHGGRDRDALGDGLGGVAHGVEVGEDLARPRRRRRRTSPRCPGRCRETGPKVSIATMTPTVVSRPQPASAMRNSDRTIEPPPSRNAT